MWRIRSRSQGHFRLLGRAVLLTQEDHRTGRFPAINERNTMKSTALSVEQGLDSALRSFKDQASAVKNAHDIARQEIRDDAKASDLGKRERLDALKQQTRSKLQAIRAEQDSYIKTLRNKVERELRGNQPSDANNVALRRDAADRAPKIADKQEPMAALAEAAVRDGRYLLAAERAGSITPPSSTASFCMARPRTSISPQPPKTVTPRSSRRSPCIAPPATGVGSTWRADPSIGCSPSVTATTWSSTKTRCSAATTSEHAEPTRRRRRTSTPTGSSGAVKCRGLRNYRLRAEESLTCFRQIIARHDGEFNDPGMASERVLPDRVFPAEGDGADAVPRVECRCAAVGLRAVDRARRAGGG
jgi:hypothetical protein